MARSTQWIIRMLWITQGVAVALYVLGRVAGLVGNKKTAVSIQKLIWQYAKWCSLIALLLVILLFFFAPAVSLQVWQSDMVSIFRISAQIWLIMCLAIWLMNGVISVATLLRKKGGDPVSAHGEKVKGDSLALPFLMGVVELVLALVMG